MDSAYQKKNVIMFFLLTYIFSWLLWLPAVLVKEDIFLYQYSGLLVIMGGFVPSIVGLGLAFTYGKSRGVLILLRKALIFKFSIKWYLLILLLMPSITLVSLLLTKLTGDIGFPSLLLPLLSPQLWLIIPLILFYVIMQGPLGEEFGWRGYALEKLLLRFNPFVCSIILGFLWAVWHLPLFFIEGTTQHNLAAQGIVSIFLGYILYTLMLSVLITIIYLRTGRSLLSALLFHAVANFFHGLFTVITVPYGGISVIIMLLIVTSIVVVINTKTPPFYDGAF